MNTVVHHFPLLVKLCCIGLLFCSPLLAEEEVSAEIILKDMSNEVATLRAFQITGDGYTDARFRLGAYEQDVDVSAAVTKEPFPEPGIKFNRE